MCYFTQGPNIFRAGPLAQVDPFIYDIQFICATLKN